MEVKVEEQEQVAVPSANGHGVLEPAEMQVKQEVKQEEGQQETSQQEEVKQEEVTDEEVKQRLLVLLGNSDLSTTTEKMLRKQLEEELGTDLTSKKALIRAEVVAYLEQHPPPEEEGGEEDGNEQEEEEESEDNQKAGKRRAGGGFGKMCLLSEELQQFVGAEMMARTQVVKTIWDYIKANNLQEPSNKRNIIIDDKLGTLFVKPLTMFSMNKQLTRHIFNSSEVTGGGDGEAKPRPAKRPKKKAASDDEDGAPKRKAGGYCRPQRISEDLAAALGKSEATYGELSKWLHSYATEHNLKDPSDKRFCLSDDTLLKLTGQRRFQLFGGQKYLKDHLLK